MFGRGSSRRRALTPLGVNAEFVFDAAQAFLERAGHSGGNTAGMPVESEDAVERLEPERIGQGRSSSSGPRSATMRVAISRARRVMRVKSHAGACPGCNGKLANPVRRGM